MTPHANTEEPYIPPNNSECREATFPVELTEDKDEFIVRIRSFQSWVVDFAMNQLTEFGYRQSNVARIDCCHSMIHRHQFVRSTGLDIFDHRKILKIPAGQEGWEVVSSGYMPAYDTMFNEWEENLQRWRNG